MDRFERPVDRGALAASVGLDPGRPIIGTVGRLIAEKGHTYLAQAMPEIARRHPGVQLLIVGGGPLQAALEREIRECTDAPTVITGLRPDVPDLLQLMDVFVFPSLSEGSPIAALEAMAAGVALACTDIPALAEIVRDGETGLVFSARDPVALADAVCRLLGDTTLRKALAARARERVRSEFTEAAMARSYEALYRAEASRPRNVSAGAKDGPKV
jgi:glycosyltransferase involved in cell wall biosynthesis